MLSTKSFDKLFGSWVRSFRVRRNYYRGFYKAKLNRERITALAIEALMQRRKSPASTRGVIRNVSGPIQFYLDTRDESNPNGITLTGESSVALLRDYLESAAERGRAAQGAVKSPP